MNKRRRYKAKARRQALRRYIESLEFTFISEDEFVRLVFEDLGENRIVRGNFDTPFADRF